MHGLLKPAQGRMPSYTQLYFYDPIEATEYYSILDIVYNLDQEVLNDITEYLYIVNPYARLYLFARERI
jgi:hypothetical protein